MTALRIDVRNNAGASVFDLYGDLSADGEAQLGEAYQASTDGGIRNIILHLRNAEYINTSGISVLITLAKNALRDGISLSIAGASDHYRKVFDLLQISSFLSIFDDEEAALAAIDV